jgi:hypothetical protein
MGGAGGDFLAELLGAFLGDVIRNRHESLLFEFRFRQAMLLIDVNPGNSQLEKYCLPGSLALHGLEPDSHGETF